jgi:isoprenylcysteine carboxyl methyltransferase (ICMT) family protein YpbQ
MRGRPAGEEVQCSRLEVHAPGIRLLGLAILLAATALTLWARLALGTMWILYFPIYLVLLQFKIHTEERPILAEFPDGYPR